MAGNSGNGKAGTLRERIARNQAERDRAIAELEGVEWEDEVTETQIHVHGGTVHVGETGRRRAMPGNNEITTPDNPKPDSTPPKVKAFERVIGAVDTWPKAAAFAVLVAAIVALAIWGPEWARGLFAP